MLSTPRRSVRATELRTIAPNTADYRRWIDICAQAYPRMKLATVEQRDNACARSRDFDRGVPEQRVVGAYRDDVLVGGMRVYDFTMCVRGAQVFTGGVGSIAVGFEYKRRGIARDLVRGYVTEYRERGAALAVLYPFRPDFYHALGFGYGTKINAYRISLEALSDDGACEQVRALGATDNAEFLALYNRVQAHTNGLIRREPWRAAMRLEDPTFATFGYTDATGLRGYLTLEVRLGEAGTANRDELFVHELIYETPAALRGLLAFASSQRDQFDVLVLPTYDSDFHFAVRDPRNGSDRNLYPPVAHETNAQGVGEMYRAIDVGVLIGALRECTFGDLDAVVRIDLDDPFLADNAGTYAIRFSRGRPELVTAVVAADVEVAIGIADFSALVMGSVRLRSLVAYGRAVLSGPAWLRRLDAAFSADPPQCLTRF